jgi:hypothetical protein
VSLLTQICLVRETFRWKLKGGDVKLVIILFIKIYMGCNLYVANAHSRPLYLGKVNNDGRMFVWLSNAPFSQKHGCESEKFWDDMIPLVTVKLEDFLWTTKTCSNHNSSYNYIKKYMFRTLIYNIYPSPVHENAHIKINKLIDYNMSSSYQSFFPH